MNHDSSALREPVQDNAAWMAALANGSITLLAPTILAAIAVYRSETVRPVPPTALSSTLDALPVAAGALPIAVLVAWRTYVHVFAQRAVPEALRFLPLVGASSLLAGAFILWAVWRGNAG